MAFLSLLPISEFDLFSLSLPLSMHLSAAQFNSVQFKSIRETLLLLLWTFTTKLGSWTRDLIYTLLFFLDTSPNLLFPWQSNPGTSIPKHAQQTLMRGERKHKVPNRASVYLAWSWGVSWLASQHTHTHTHFHPKAIGTQNYDERIRRLSNETVWSVFVIPTTKPNHTLPVWPSNVWIFFFFFSSSNSTSIALCLA